MAQADEPATWFARRTYASSDFSTEGLTALKRAAGTRVSVILPSRNVVSTIAGVVNAVRTLSGTLVDEIVVIDAGSTDGTAAAGRAAGANVYSERDVQSCLGGGLGKGDGMWRSLAVSSGDLVAFMDTDIRNPGPHYIWSVIGPLLLDSRLQLVKGFYRRPIEIDGVRFPTGGGRVTELCARPLLNAFWPELSGLIQPLSGEFAARRTLLESLPFSTGYGVEIGLLIDTYLASGLDAIAQVDLGERVHANQPLDALSRMAFEVSQAAMRRLARQHRVQLSAGELRRYVQFRQGGDGQTRMAEQSVNILERPPLRDFDPACST